MGAELLYGWTAEEARGMRSVRFLYANPAQFEASKKLLLEHGQWGGELRHLNRQGKEVIVNSRWTLLRDTRGNPHSILVIDTDISDRKHLEAQFLRAQRMESIGTLASGIAHDLNNILAPILMSVTTLRAGLKAEQEEKTLATIEASAQRGSEIIQQLLTFGRGVQGDRVPIQLRHLIRDMIKIARET